MCDESYHSIKPQWFISHILKIEYLIYKETECFSTLEKHRSHFIDLQCNLSCRCWVFSWTVEWCLWIYVISTPFSGPFQCLLMYVYLSVLTWVSWSFFSSDDPSVVLRGVEIWITIILIKIQNISITLESYFLLL